MFRLSTLPVLAHSLAQIPGRLGGELGAQVGAHESVCSLVYVPADATAPARGAWARTRGVQVLAVTNQRILVGAEAAHAGEPRWVGLIFHDILAWELQQHLLYGQIQIRGAAHARAWLEFHTGGVDEVAQALAPLERAILGLERSPGADVARLPEVDGAAQYLASSLRQALLPGEVVRRSMFQPLIERASLPGGRQLLATPTLAVATDRRLLVIREAPHILAARYGHDTWSLPRYRADDLVVRVERGLALLEYGPDPTALRLLCARDAGPALQKLVAALHAQGSSPPGRITQRLDRS